MSRAFFCPGAPIWVPLRHENASFNESLRFNYENDYEIIFYLISLLTRHLPASRGRDHDLRRRGTFFFEKSRC